ncbi:MAG TPA: hypothetical protein V6C88_04505 [Chroococcidiopsis sp.]
MEQLKSALGPFELFASIVGGAPLAIAVCLIFNPAYTPYDLTLLVQNNLSGTAVLLLLFLSYILGGAIQGVTWRYFLALCKFFNHDYHYFRAELFKRSPAINSANSAANPTSIQTSETDATTDRPALEFEDKLVLLLREQMGMPKNIDWLDARLAAYLKAHDKASVTAAESHMANHIMYRNLSFGCVVLSAVMVINLFRAQSLTFEQPVLTLLLLGLAYVTFFRSVSFKRWHQRDVVLGFYFTAKAKQDSHDNGD